MEAEWAAVSLQVYEEIDKSQKNPFLEYLEPTSRENEVPDSMSMLSANDQSSVPLENVTTVETPALSNGVGKVELSVPVSGTVSVSRAYHFSSGVDCDFIKSLGWRHANRPYTQDMEATALHP